MYSHRKEDFRQLNQNKHFKCLFLSFYHHHNSKTDSKCMIKDEIKEVANYFKPHKVSKQKRNAYKEKV